MALTDNDYKKMGLNPKHCGDMQAFIDKKYTTKEITKQRKIEIILNN